MSMKKELFFIATVFSLIIVILMVGKTQIKAEELTITCTPNWNCTAWTPEKCPRNETQFRQCVDLNGCGSDLPKPQEKQMCQFVIEYNRDAVNALLVLAIFTAVISIIELIKRFKEEKWRPHSLPETKYSYSP